ncbi:MAG: hypothetical protein MZV70_13720 [Desulfobacterales bacterium]|nr:hypothetical protein [Desulfobacterales bacterium]
MWREQPQWITDYAGAASLYALSRDLYSQGYLASPERPVRLVIAGPARLRIEARALHRRGGTRPSDGWMRVSDGKGLSLVPVSNNLPQQGLVIVGDEAHIPWCCKVMSDVPYGPGTASGWKSSPENTDRLRRRVLAEQPLFCLSRPSAHDARDGRRGPQGRLQAVQGWAVPSGPCCPGDPEWPLHRSLDRERGASDRPRQRGKGLMPCSVPGEKDIGEMQLLLHEETAETGSDRSARLLAAGDVEGALAVPTGEGEGRSWKRVLLLLRLSSGNPLNTLRALAEAEALASRHSRREGTEAPDGENEEEQLLVPRHIRRRERRAPHRRSHGLASRVPFLRTRKALMNPSPGRSMSSTATAGSSSSCRTSKPRRSMSPWPWKTSPTSPAAEMIATYQLDDGETTWVVLTAGQPLYSARISVPQGRHALGIALEKRLLDQYLRVRILEQDGGDTLSCPEGAETLPCSEEEGAHNLDCRGTCLAQGRRAAR